MRGSGWIFFFFNNIKIHVNSTYIKMYVLLTSSNFYEHSINWETNETLTLRLLLHCSIIKERVILLLDHECTSFFHLTAQACLILTQPFFDQAVEAEAFQIFRDPLTP